MSLISDNTKASITSPGASCADWVSDAPVAEFPKGDTVTAGMG